MRDASVGLNICESQRSRMVSTCEGAGRETPSRWKGALTHGDDRYSRSHRPTSIPSGPGAEPDRVFLLLSSTGLAYRRCRLDRVNGDQIEVTFLRKGKKSKGRPKCCERKRPRFPLRLFRPSVRRAAP